MYQTIELPKAWVKFVSQWPWDWFCHLTYRDNPFTDEMMHPEAAIKIYDKWIHTLNREIFGVRYWKRSNDGVIWTRAREYQYRGAIHFHCLIGRVPDWVSRLKYMDLHDQLGGYARIQPYKGKGCGAEEYLCKSAYAFKKGDIDVGGPLKYFQEGCPLLQNSLFAYATEERLKK
jgi:hypothetical protein